MRKYLGMALNYMKVQIHQKLHVHCFMSGASLNSENQKTDLEYPTAYFCMFI